MPELSFKQTLIINEIEGKNKAIHAYDNIIWVVRTGYLTLIFGTWALLLKGLIDNGSTYGLSMYISPMIIISLGLTIGGMIIDFNYIYRKYKVINSLNQLMNNAFTSFENVEGNDNQDNSDILNALLIAGDEKFIFSAFVAAILYLAPILCLSISWFYLNEQINSCFDFM